MSFAQKHPFRLAGIALALVMAGGVYPQVTSASQDDTITLTSPNNTVVAESDDYATQVLGDPWDMSNVEDVDYLDHMTPPTLNNGVWSSTATSSIAQMFLQYQGWPDSMDYMAERNGVNYPIESQRFSRLRVRMYSSIPTQVVAWYYRTRNWTPGGNSNIISLRPGWNIYDIDLNGVGGGGSGTWFTSNWNGLRFDPVFNGQPNTNIQVDWARLTPATGSSVNITWTATGTNPISLQLDTDQNAGNGTEMDIVTNLPASSRSYNWNSAGIAPGTYFVRALMGGASSYSGPLIVNQAPVLDLIAPGPTSGEDYATTRLGTPWTGSRPSDLQYFVNIWSVAFTPSYMQASGNGDPQLWYLNNDRARAIDTNRYHYISYNLYLQRPAENVGGNYYQWNGGPRVIWSPGTPLNWQSTKVVIGWYDRWNRVAFDLRTAPLEPGSTLGWQGTQAIFRFDPHEEAGEYGSSIFPPFFRLGQVRLTADPKVANGGTTLVSWVPLKTAGNVTLSYSTSPAGGGTAFATVPVSTGGYVWAVNGLPSGNYWITAVANDGVNTFRQVSKVPIFVSGSRSCPPAFSDVPQSNAFYQYISDLYCRKVVEGYSDNTFRWAADATRGTLAEWVVRSRGWAIDTTGAPHFSDVPASDPLYPYIETAFNRGVISGYSDGTFRPSNGVTRGQMSKMVVSAMGWPIDTTGGPHFTDVAPDNPFYGYIETIYLRGVVSGYTDRTFRWGNNNTRGQLSKVLSNSIGR